MVKSFRVYQVDIRVYQVDIRVYQVDIRSDRGIKSARDDTTDRASGPRRASVAVHVLLA